MYYHDYTKGNNMVGIYEKELGVWVISSDILNIRGIDKLTINGFGIKELLIIGGKINLIDLEIKNVVELQKILLEANNIDIKHMSVGMCHSLRYIQTNSKKNTNISDLWIHDCSHLKNIDLIFHSIERFEEFALEKCSNLQEVSFKSDNEYPDKIFIINRYIDQETGAPKFTYNKRNKISMI